MYRSMEMRAYAEEEYEGEEDYLGASDEELTRLMSRTDSKVSDTSATLRKLIVSTCFCVLFMLAEITGGIISNSLAILTDAAHLLSDVAAFCVSMLAVYLTSLEPSDRLTYGWHRAEILGALLSILIIWVLTGCLVFEATRRAIVIIAAHMAGQPPPIVVNGKVMLIIASLGILVNITMLVLLGHGGAGGHGHSHGGDSGSGGHGHSHGGGGKAVKAKGSKGEEKSQQNMNVRAAYVHVLGDLLQSAGVIPAAIVIMVKPTWVIADPLCTVFFSLIVMGTTIPIMKSSLMVLMESTPRGISVRELTDQLSSIRVGNLTVEGITQLHVWAISPSKIAMAAHLKIGDTGAEGKIDPNAILHRAQLIADAAGVDPECTTFQLDYDCPHYLPVLSPKPSTSR
eukprot:NODE_582_length_1336_cov_223.542347_g455_i0.p1 GENE.NODE_582_length_1336_cov_223.542347_g455_i0~~NODE_582_length_1336_cov_223.542347_g455_i0.p1  ORF type:complete len:398 (+),score=112.53 NODE_582_length_1336_cov_223.542347_g455_i0:42-1235(+)